MSIISTSDFHKGVAVMFRNEPHIITECTFVNPGKGSAFTRTRLKSLITGRVLEFTFKSGEKIEEAPIEIREVQYLYNDTANFYFMNQRNFEQYSLSAEMVGNFKNFIKEGEIYQIFVMDEKAVAFKAPLKVRLKVTEAEEGVKGNTVSGATKTVTLETGYKINVPLFIKTGETIAINPETNQYLERSN
jgi:elongation factor P